MEPNFELGDNVKYKGENRPYLKNRSGKIVAFNLTKTSARVSFKREGDLTPYEEWVGVGSLELIEDGPATAEDVLRDELRTLNEEWVTVSARYRKLSARKTQLENALLALNSTLR